jgi:hypothetical protein
MGNYIPVRPETPVRRWPDGRDSLSKTRFSFQERSWQGKSALGSTQSIQRSGPQLKSKRIRLFESNLLPRDAKGFSFANPYGGIFSPAPLPRFHQEVVSMLIKYPTQERALSHTRTKVFQSPCDEERQRAKK